MKVSVIVPVYNVENYIEQCLSSLANQTLKDMEVIIVDDGSTDGSIDIAKGFLEKYPSLFQLVHKQNGGLSDARNFGISYATGEYISFLDSDDYVEPTLYELLSKEMDKGQDVVVTNIEYFFEDITKNFVMRGLSNWKAKSISKKALLSPMFAWNKMYKASYFKEDGYRYPVGTWYEDIPVTTPIFATTNKIGYVDECLIHYRQRSGSIMSSLKSERLKEIFNVMQQVRDTFHSLGLYEEYKTELEYLHIEHLRLYGMFRFMRSPLLSELYEMSDKCMKEYFPNWKNNPYISNLGFKNRFFLKYYSASTNWLFKIVIK